MVGGDDRFQLISAIIVERHVPTRLRLRRVVPECGIANLRMLYGRHHCVKSAALFPPIGTLLDSEFAEQADPLVKTAATEVPCVEAGHVGPHADRLAAMRTDHPAERPGDVMQLPAGQPVRVGGLAIWHRRIGRRSSRLLGTMSTQSFSSFMNSSISSAGERSYRVTKRLGVISGKTAGARCRIGPRPHRFPAMIGERHRMP